MAGIRIVLERSHEEPQAVFPTALVCATYRAKSKQVTQLQW